MLQWIFGPMNSFSVEEKNDSTNSGTLKLTKANVNWYLSIDSNNLPQDIKSSGLTTYRVLSVDGQEVEFSKGFTDLHTISYQKIIDGKGFGLIDAKNSIEIVNKIRNQN